MAHARSLYLTVLKFPSYETAPFRAKLTPKEAFSVAMWLESFKEGGLIEDYYLGPPEGPEFVHAPWLTERSLRSELEDLILLENRAGA